MAKAAVKSPQQRANEMRDLINEGVALQIELLGAAVRVWSTIFESMSSYTKTASEELLRATAHGDANAALDNVIAEARKKLKTLTVLPESIGKDFESRVKQRARTKN